EALAIMIGCTFLILAISSIGLSEAWCPTNFIALGTQCYFFSDIKEPWHEALGVCEGLGDFLDMEVSLAVMDVGPDSEKQNKLLLSTILDNNNNYWLGGHAEEGSREFKWDDGRLIDPTYSYWYHEDPTDIGNCVSVNITPGGITRAYLYSTDCSASLNVVCQTTPPDLIPKPDCPSFFKDVGGYCMVFSKYLGAEKMTWDDARSFCRQLGVSGTVDLAVLGIKGEQDQKVLSEILATGEDSTWLGVRKESGNSSMFWIDGRPVDPTAYYWYHSEDPNLGDNAARAGAHTSNGHTTIKLHRASHASSLHFVCQLY
ncbi:unnamed protein product, partial [Meganyctiphanes norvegica]